jgi:hypothetical protein
MKKSLFVDSGWTTGGHCIDGILTHAQKHSLRGFRGNVDNVDNHFLATKVKDIYIRVNTYIVCQRKLTPRPPPI